MASSWDNSWKEDDFSYFSIMSCMFSLFVVSVQPWCIDRNVKCLYIYIPCHYVIYIHMKHEFVIYAPNVRIKEMHWHTYCTFSFPPQVAMPVETLRLGWELNASHMSAVTAWEPGITFNCTVLAASNWPEDRRISKYSASWIRKRHGSKLKHPSETSRLPCT